MVGRMPPSSDGKYWKMASDEWLKKIVSCENTASDDDAVIDCSIK